MPKRVQRKANSRDTEGTSPSARGGARRRNPEVSSRSGEETSARRSASRGTLPTLDDIAAQLLDHGIPLPRLYTALLRQFLEPQKMWLEGYQKALADRSLNDSAEEYLRQMMKAMMAAYLEIMKSLPEHRDRLVEAHADVVKTYLDAIKDLLHEVDKTRA